MSDKRLERIVTFDLSKLNISHERRWAPACSSCANSMATI